MPTLSSYHWGKWLSNKLLLPLTTHAVQSVSICQAQQAVLITTCACAINLSPSWSLCSLGPQPKAASGVCAVHICSVLGLPRQRAGRLDADLPECRAGPLAPCPGRGCFQYLLKTIFFKLSSSEYLLQSMLLGMFWLAIVGQAVQIYVHITITKLPTTCTTNHLPFQRHGTRPGTISKEPTLDRTKQSQRLPTGAPLICAWLANTMRMKAGGLDAASRWRTTE